MADYGTKATDKAIKKLDKEIQSVYEEAAKDIKKKTDDFFKKYKAKDSIMREKLKKGEITKDDYNKWIKGQLFQADQWKSKQYEIEQILTNTNKIAVQMINNESIHIFSKNANYESYKIEHTAGVNFGFSLYDSEAVTNLVKNNPQVLPKWKIDEPKDYTWNGKKVNRQITQGIIQGESLDQIAKRLATNLSAQNYNHMRTFARTAMTGAQNAGRNQSLTTAKDMGINVVKEWMSTLDGRTRDSHRDMDGEQIPVGDKWHPTKFSNGLKFPGDPEGPAREVYNCRCTLVGDLVDFPAEYERYDNINGKPIKNMTYREWEKAKEAQKKHNSTRHTVVNGKDISGTWKRRKEFDFEIEDVINAQGYDGLPKIVDADEFDKAVEKCGFICKRGYTAPNEETLDLYRDQLYNGKWYVDCSKGGSSYGQGMYSVSTLGKKLSDYMENTVSSYGLGGQRNKLLGVFGNIETFTLTPNAKIIDSKELFNERYKIIYDIKRSKIKEPLTEGEELFLKLNSGISLSESEMNKLSEAQKNGKADIKKIAEINLRVTKDTINETSAIMRMDEGSLCALRGYDAIRIPQGRDDSYIIVVNRTKCIFKREKWN